MGDVYVGINLEFGRLEGRSFQSSVATAAEMGFTLIEPMVHWGRELLSAAGYFHTISMLDDQFVCDTLRFIVQVSRP